MPPTAAIAHIGAGPSVVVVPIVDPFPFTVDGVLAAPRLPVAAGPTSTVLARTGTTAAAVHEGLVTLPTGGADRRLVIEDAEPVTVESGGALAASTLVAYREVVEIPESW